MHSSGFVEDLALAAGIAGLTGLLFRLLKQPSILGYLLAGLIVGPYLPMPLFANPERLHALSEFGVIFEMFAVGLEFRIAKVLQVLPLSGVTGQGTGTMLDNSACMWLPELADGNAHNNNLPIVIAGSCGGYLKQGVSVNLDGGDLGAGSNQTSDSEASCKTEGEEAGNGTGSNGGQVPLNKSYTTLIDALGAGDPSFTPIDSWGVSDAGGGGFGGPGITFTTDGSGNITSGPGITQPGELSAIRA